MRRAAKVDANQNEITAALRKVGATVQHLHSIGAGCPDLLVGLGGQNYLLEIKDGSLPPSKRKLTRDELAWHGWWAGEVFVVHNVDDAVRAVLGEAMT